MGKIRVGCTVWSFTNPASPYAPPYEDAIEAIGTLGLDTIELILREAADLENYWTRSRIKAIRDRLDFHKTERIGHGQEIESAGSRCASR